VGEPKAHAVNLARSVPFGMLDETLKTSQSSEYQGVRINKQVAHWLANRLSSDWANYRARCIRVLSAMGLAMDS
jgi:hypothetical protein